MIEFISVNDNQWNMQTSFFIPMLENKFSFEIVLKSLALKFSKHS